MRLLFLGDIVGRSGREAIIKNLPTWKKKLFLDFVVANGENATHGFGLSTNSANELLSCGVDVLTLGNHSWDRQDIIANIDNMPIIRPLNYPPGTPGRGSYIFETEKGKKILVINLLGRIFMEPFDDPFRKIAQLLKKYRLGISVNAIIVDIHAEATSEKMALGNFLDGEVSLVIGTHTHVPTADNRILPNGTAYQTDAGMCGFYDSIIGMQKQPAINRLLNHVPKARQQPAEGDASICGLFVDIDDKTGLANYTFPFRQGGILQESWPEDNLLK